MNAPKIGLDIDDVIADFIPAFALKYGLELPNAWAWSYRKDECFKDLMRDKAEMQEFYLSLPVKIAPESIPFEPHCYITSRSIPIGITQKWIELNNFPCAPVYTVDFNHSKVEVARMSGVDVYIDDRFENFVELNNAGICTYLFDCTHNQRYDVGEMRIKSLNDLPWFR